jgi:transcriptional regulator GlxA family with amidase domain
MRSRIEIAKERLRSSNSSEAAIADMCGFKSVSEMEKYFRRFCHTSPYKYRVEQQVT